MPNGGLHGDDVPYPPLVWEQVKRLYDDNQRLEKEKRKLLEVIEMLKSEKAALMESLRMIRGEPK